MGRGFKSRLYYYQVMREKLIAEFPAKYEDGTPVMIEAYQTIIDVSTRGNPQATTGGLKRLQTDNGDALNYISPGVYEDPGIWGSIRGKITSDHPDAI